MTRTIVSDRSVRLSARWAAAAALFALVCSAACVSHAPITALDPFAVRKLPDNLAADASRVVAANNRFAFDLFAQLRATDGNLFLSPYSISTALQMTAAGARGGTAVEMARVLQLELPLDWAHPASGALVQSLDRGIALGGYRLSVANRLWGQSGYDFLEPFLATTRDHYGAELEPVDFRMEPESARSTINSWVEEKTENRIVELLPQGVVTADTRLVLTNAIYFKGDWARMFERDRTRPAPFHVSPSQDVEVMMMSQDASFRFAHVGATQVLEMPYVGNDLSMLVLLPESADGLPALEDALSIANLDLWTAALDTSRLIVSVPRFRVESAFSLSQTLKTMGMPSAFDLVTADFSGINGRRDLSISAVVHKGFVEVNEEGTEAAAATGVVIGVVSAPPSFTAEHPFLFLIRDNVTGSVLFLGRVVDPTAAAG